jgi:hypothetical protein
MMYSTRSTRTIDVLPRPLADELCQAEETIKCIIVPEIRVRHPRKKIFPVLTSRANFKYLLLFELLKSPSATIQISKVTSNGNGYVTPTR